MTSGQDEEVERHDGDGASLPRDVQEHLGRRLRRDLQVETARPGYLGDANLPPQFEAYVRRLEAGERVERQGFDAVKRALDDLVRDEPA